MAEPGVGEAVSHVAERVGHLVDQHVKLLRAEAEEIGHTLAQQAKYSGTAIAIAAPICVAGLLLVSLGVAQWIGVALEPGLGRAATPIATLLIGVWEIAIAAGWLWHRMAGQSAAIRELRTDIQPSQLATRRRAHGSVG